MIHHIFVVVDMDAHYSRPIAFGSQPRLICAGNSMAAPGFCQLEQDTIAWLCGEFGYDSKVRTAGGCSACSVALSIFSLPRCISVSLHSNPPPLLNPHTRPHPHFSTLAVCSRPADPLPILPRWSRRGMPTLGTRVCLATPPRTLQRRQVCCSPVSGDCCVPGL